MKKWVALLLILSLGLVAAACKPIDPVKDAAKVVASVGDVNITKGEAQKAYTFYANSIQNYYMIYYGQQIDLTDKAVIADLKSETLDFLTQTMVMENELAKLGAALTEEEIQAAEQSASEQYESLVSQFLASGAADDATARKQVDDAGYYLDIFKLFRRNNAISTKYYDTVVKDVALTDEEIQTKYDALLAAQAESFKTTPGSYASTVMSDAAVYTVPEGYRYVKNIVIGLPEDIQTQIEEKNTEMNAAYSEYYEHASSGVGHDGQPITAEQATAELTETSQALQADIDALVAQGQEAVRAKAEEVLALCRAEGADFDAIMKEYNADTTTNAALLEKGYPVAAGVTAYVQPFTDGAMALASIGDVSDLIASEYGFHILKYAADATPGPIALETVKDAVSEAALTDKQRTVYDETFEKALKNYKITKHPDRI